MFFFAGRVGTFETRESDQGEKYWHFTRLCIHRFSICGQLWVYAFIFLYWKYYAFLSIFMFSFPFILKSFKQDAAQKMMIDVGDSGLVVDGRRLFFGYRYWSNLSEFISWTQNVIVKFYVMFIHENLGFDQAKFRSLLLCFIMMKFYILYFMSDPILTISLCENYVWSRNSKLLPNLQKFCNLMHRLLSKC